MNTLTAQAVLAAFAVFSRIGACLMLVPGFSSPRIPVQVRLFVAIALSLALTPLVFDTLKPLINENDPLGLLRLIVSELLIGAMIGLLARFYFVALETIAMGLAMSIGLSSNIGAPVNEEEPLPAVTTLLTLAATTLIFITDQHLALFRALAASYTALPAGGDFAPRFGLTQLADAAAQSFLLALRVGSPFLIFSLVLNIATGLVNRLVPNVQVFFLATPFLLLGGLLLLYVTVKPLLDIFIGAFGNLLVHG